MYYIEKTLEYYSCAFRQPNAFHSHCRLNHGYALSFKFCLQSEALDLNNWVFDYGNFSAAKEFLKENFDHTTAISAEDPHLDYFKQGHELGVLDLRIMPAVGCEAFANYVFNWKRQWLNDNHGKGIKLKYVQVSEHGNNTAGYMRTH